MGNELTEVDRQHEVIGNKVTNAVLNRTTHPDAQWFPQAGLGLFLHWGISSVRGEGDLSWSMIELLQGVKRRCMEKNGTQGVIRTMTPTDYWAQASGFKADRYDPKRWLLAAKKAGFTYAVLTTKHHDGFALWPSEYGDFGTRTHLSGRDLVGEYVTACRDCGMKVGLYFSMPDWYYARNFMSFHYATIDHFRQRKYVEGLPFWGVHHEPVAPMQLTDSEYARWTEQYKRFCQAQLHELLTRYGKIDLLWFDGSEPGAVTKRFIQELQPGIVVNDRMGFGDYFTPEVHFPERRPSTWWEQCDAWNEGGWGYRTHEIYKPTGWVVSSLMKARAWGGNLLLNVAPDSHGELPPVAYARMSELAEWMEQNHDVVFGISAGTWPEQSNVPVTCKEQNWYFHVDWVFDGPVVATNLPHRPINVSLRSNGKKLEYEYDGDRLTIPVQQHEISLMGEIIEVKWR